MFLTDDQCLQSVADMLKTAKASLPAYWSSVVSEAHAGAYNEIVGRLLRRGFTLAQITAWDRGAEFERQLTLFWALTNGGGLNSYDDKFIKTFDRRKDLDDVQFSIANVFINPVASDGPGQVGIGSEDTSNDLFSLDPDDVRRGHPTRW